MKVRAYSRHKITQHQIPHNKFEAGPGESRQGSQGERLAPMGNRPPFPTPCTKTGRRRPPTHRLGVAVQVQIRLQLPHQRHLAVQRAAEQSPASSSTPTKGAGVGGGQGFSTAPPGTPAGARVLQNIVQRQGRAEGEEKQVGPKSAGEEKEVGPRRAEVEEQVGTKRRELEAPGCSCRWQQRWQGDTGRQQPVPAIM